MCALSQVVLRAATLGRLVQAQHPPAHSIAISAVARRTVVTLQGVAAHQIEKRATLLLDCANHFKLLSRCKRSQIAAKAPPAYRLSLLQTVAIGILVTPEVANKLLVDIREHSGLRSAGKAVRGNNLIADCRQRPGLGVAEKIPIALPARGAAYGNSRSP